MCMQNLVLAVQNSISIRDVGAATASVTFFRSLGGAIGIQALGFVFSDRLKSLVTSGIPHLGTQAFTTDAMANPSVGAICSTAQNPATADLAQIQANCPATTDFLHDVGLLQHAGGTSMDLTQFHYLPFRELIEQSISNSIGNLFLIGSIISALSIVAVWFMRSTKLRTHFEDNPPISKK